MKELDSPVADFSLLPRSRRKHMESGQTTLQVSTAISWNWYAQSRWAYFLAFSVCATEQPASLVVA